MQPNSQCPHFERCATNACPLTFGYASNQYETSPLDFETKCAVRKSIRQKIGANTTLQYKGLTRAEYAQSREFSQKCTVIKEAHKKDGKILVA